MRIDLVKWAATAQPQRPEKNWCWAACLAALARYQTDTQIVQEHFVTYAQPELNGGETLTWETYTAFASRLHSNGIEYNDAFAPDGSPLSRRKLNFEIDIKHYFNITLALQELTEDRPVIVTLHGGLHDVVVIGLEMQDPSTYTVRYWNPSDNLIYNADAAQFAAMNPICTVSAAMKPRIVQIPFVRGGFL